MQDVNEKVKFIITVCNGIFLCQPQNKNPAVKANQYG